MLAILDPTRARTCWDRGGVVEAALMHDYFYLPTGRKQAALAKDISSLQSYYHDLKTGQTPLTRREAQLARADVRQVIKPSAPTRRRWRRWRRRSSRGSGSTPPSPTCWTRRSRQPAHQRSGTSCRYWTSSPRPSGPTPRPSTTTSSAGAGRTRRRGRRRESAGIGAEILSAETGPFAPVIGYSVTSLFSEYTHNVPWDLDVHNHGVVAGVGLGVGQGFKDFWQNDVKGAGEQIGQSVEPRLASRTSGTASSDPAPPVQAAPTDPGKSSYVHPTASGSGTSCASGPGGTTSSAGSG
ncbi:hypothetical protein GXW82_08650 [Streptacidiphilus sp. 4-A2]|nr:hypothetical protein [Streptacidiphilus sp. 4-A2]